MKISDVAAVNRILKIEYAKRHAPIVELVAAQTNDPFKILLTTILSARTKDETTAQVAHRLFKTIDKPADLMKVTQKQLEKLIFPIGFFRTKARHIKLLPAAMDKLFGGNVPDTIDELCQLPGVGRKTANLVLINAFDKHAMCVDVHVHRICNRLGLIRTKDPTDSEMTLRSVLPKRYWKTWNRFLVSYGQTTCTPIGPRCSTCPIHKYCARRDVKKSR